MRSAAGRKWLSGLLIGSSLLLALALLGDWLPWLRGPAPETSEWYWPYLLRPVQDWWLAAAAALFLWLVAAWWIYQKVPHRAQNSGAMLLLFVASLLLQLGIIYADRQEIAAELIDRTLSNQASGFFEAAAEIDDLGQALASYPDLMPEFISEHARTHPPGLIAANWATIKLLERTEKLATTIARHVVPLRCADLWLLNRPAAVSAALGIWSVLPLLFAAATVFPAYAVAGFFVNDYAKRLAAVFAASLPALLLFAPKSVQLYAPLALLLFWSFHGGLLDKSWWRLVLAGFLLSLLTFLSFGNASLLLFLALYAILVLLGPFRQLGGEPRSSLSWKDLIMPAVAFGIG
ncbi:MAG: hypothetical protein ACK2UK_04520, partial [Candidatus Promineifilaceae bacterium]